MISPASMNSTSPRAWKSNTKQPTLTASSLFSEGWPGRHEDPARRLTGCTFPENEIRLGRQSPRHRSRHITRTERVEASSGHRLKRPASTRRTLNSTYRVAPLQSCPAPVMLELKVSSGGDADAKDLLCPTCCQASSGGRRLRMPPKARPAKPQAAAASMSGVTRRIAQPTTP
jgi:hypothetical protein